MEKLLDLYISETVEQNAPLSDQQSAYQKGKSSELQ